MGYNTIYGVESNEIGVEFSPFSKLATKIDETLSLLNYHKSIGNLSEIAKNEAKLKDLRSEIAKVKSRCRV